MWDYMKLIHRFDNKNYKKCLELDFASLSNGKIFFYFPI